MKTTILTIAALALIALPTRADWFEGDPVQDARILRISFPGDNTARTTHFPRTPPDNQYPPTQPPEKRIDWPPAQPAGGQFASYPYQIAEIR